MAVKFPTPDTASLPAMRAYTQRIEDEVAFKIVSGWDLRTNTIRVSLDDPDTIEGEFKVISE